MCFVHPQLLKSWGYSRADITHYLRCMEAVLQAEQDRKQAAAAAATAAVEAAAVEAAAAAAADGLDDSSSTSLAAAAEVEGSLAQVDSSGSISQPRRSETPTGAGATAKSRLQGAANAAGRGAKTGGFVGAAAAVKAGLRAQGSKASSGSNPAGSRGGGRANTVGGGAAGASSLNRSDSGSAAASLAVQLEVRCWVSYAQLSVTAEHTVSTAVVGRLKPCMHQQLCR